MFYKVIVVIGVMLFFFGMVFVDLMMIEYLQGSIDLFVVLFKVFVLDINVLDIVDVMGVEFVGVVNGNLFDYLQKYVFDDYLKVGMLFELDYEVVVVLGVDLMIVGICSWIFYFQMLQILLIVDLSVGDDLFVLVDDNIVWVGQIFGKLQCVVEMIVEIDGKLVYLKQVVLDVVMVLIFVINGGKLGVYGFVLCVGWIYKELGFVLLEENIDDCFYGGDVILFEYIFEKNLDWIFVIDRDVGVGDVGVGVQLMLDNVLMVQIKVVQQGQVVYLDVYVVYVVYVGYIVLNCLLD